MADETQVTETETTTDGASTTETGKDGTAFDAGRAQRTIDQLRDEVKAGKAASKELADARARLKDIEDKDKSETERLASRAQEATEKLSAAEQRAADLALQMSVERAARKLGYIDEDDAYRLIDRRAVETGDDGMPTNVETLLKALATSKPHLVKAPEGDGDSAPPRRAATRDVPTTPRPTGRTQSRDELVAEHEKQLQATGQFAPI